ncbi:MAG: hypothetical protein ACFFEN_11335 [Candidatus Thorarchaeota archaeon]
MSENKSNSSVNKIVILLIFIVVIVLTAEVDWAAMHKEVGMTLKLVWLISLLSLGLILPIGFMYLAGNKESERGESDKKWFIISIVLFLFANGIPIVFYVVLGIAPGFLLYVQLALFGLIPAFFLQPRKTIIRLLILVILFVGVIIPIGILVNLSINDLWSLEATDNTMYYLSFWGLLMTFFYLFIAIGWKLGGGSKRQSWNIFIAGTLLQYSTLEDFFYFFLNGQSLPYDWYWMENFVINLKVLFGSPITSWHLLIFCSITTLIAILILFDVHGYVWKKIKS